MITTDELKVQLADYGTAVKDLEEALAIDASRKRVQELEHTMSRPGFYDDAELSKKVFDEVGDLKGKLTRFEKLQGLYDDAETMLVMLDEEYDPEMVPEAEEAVNAVGKDRLVDAAYAAANFPLPVITVDLGTATTFNVVDKDRVFRGGVICPGLSTGLRALGERCAQLPQVHLGSPKKAIGTNTESCMLSGSVLGTAVLIDGMVQRIEEELGSPATLVVTGGLAKYVTPLCRHPLTYDPELLMKGLALLYQLNAPQEHGRSHGGGRHYGQQGRLRAKHPHPNRRTRREPEALVG